MCYDSFNKNNTSSYDNLSENDNSNPQSLLSPPSVVKVGPQPKARKLILAYFRAGGPHDQMVSIYSKYLRPSDFAMARTNGPLTKNVSDNRDLSIPPFRKPDMMRQFQAVQRLPVANKGVELVNPEDIIAYAPTFRQMGATYMSLDWPDGKMRDFAGQDIVGKASAAAKAVREQGMQFMMGPDKGHNEVYGGRFAQFADYYIPQGEAYQMNLNDIYIPYYRTFSFQIRKANPGIKIFAMISTPVPADTHKIDKRPTTLADTTIADMLATWRAVSPYVDGVTIWYNHGHPQAIPALEEFLRWFRQQDY